MSKYGVFSGPYFPAFRLNTERYELSLRIQSECRKIRTRKNSLFGHLSRCDVVPVALYNAKKVSHSNTYVESKNQNTKRRMETENIPYFIFELKNPSTLIL